VKPSGLVALFTAVAFSLFAPGAQAKTLECREVETSPPWEWAYECKADWDDGSRITDEQRKTVNAVVVTTFVIPLSSRRR
jgi:hypothetical protein